MFQFDAKLIVIGALFLALVLVKLFAGRPMDRPVRRPRRFGFRGTEGPLADPEARERPPSPEPPAPAAAPPKDPEAEFFKDDKPR